MHGMAPLGVRPSDAILGFLRVPDACVCSCMTRFVCVFVRVRVDLYASLSVGPCVCMCVRGNVRACTDIRRVRMLVIRLCSAIWLCLVYIRCCD